MIMLNELYVLDPFHLTIPIKNILRSRMDWKMSMAVQPYGMWWRKHRKSFHKYFHRNVVNKYKPFQKRDVQAFLRRLLAAPDNFFQYIRQ